MAQVLNWNSHRIDDAIAEAHGLLKEAADVLAVLKANVAQTRTILAAWATPDPFSRKEGKVSYPLTQSKNNSFRLCWCSHLYAASLLLAAKSNAQALPSDAGHIMLLHAA